MLDARGAARSGCSRLFVPEFAATGCKRLLAECVFSRNPDSCQDFRNGQSQKNPGNEILYVCSTGGVGQGSASNS